MSPSPSPVARQLRLAIHSLGLTQIVGWGTTFYAAAVLAGPVIAETHWTRTEVFGAFSLSLVLGALLAGPAGRAIDRFGGRRSMALGSVIAAMGLTMAAVANSIEFYIAAWAVLGVAMRLMLYEAAFATLTAAAGVQAGRAISLLTLYGGFASTVFWPLGYALVEAFGWRWAFAIYGALNLLVCLPVHLLALPRPHAAPAEAPASAPHSADAAQYMSGAQRRFALVLLTLAIALFTYVNGALSAHMIDTLVAFGLSASAAVSVAALRGVGQFLGRLWQILFATRIGPMKLAMIAIGLTPLAFLALVSGTGLAFALTFTLLQGASNGLITIVRGVVPLALFGPKGYGALIGIMAAPGLFVSAVAPAAHAAIIEYFGHGAGVIVNLIAAAGSFLLIVVLALRLRRNRKDAAG